MPSSNWRISVRRTTSVSQLPAMFASDTGKQEAVGCLPHSIFFFLFSFFLFPFSFFLFFSPFFAFITREHRLPRIAERSRLATWRISKRSIYWTLGECETYHERPLLGYGPPLWNSSGIESSEWVHIFSLVPGPGAGPRSSYRAYGPESPRPRFFRRHLTGFTTLSSIKYQAQVPFLS